MSGYRIDLSTAQNGTSLNLSGRRIEVTGASSASALAELSAIYSSGHTRSYYEFKKGDKAFSEIPFSDLKVKNTAQPGEWIEIEVTQSEDEWVYEPRDDIFIDSITNPIEIDSTTPIKVDDDATQTSLASILAMMQNDQDKRKALTALTGATYAGGTATATIVTSGANVNGVIIRRASLTPSGSGTTCAISVGGNAIVRATGLTSFAFNDSVQDIYVPAGMAVAATITGTANYDIWYEVL